MGAEKSVELIKEMHFVSTVVPCRPISAALHMKKSKRKEDSACSSFIQSMGVWCQIGCAPVVTDGKPGIGYGVSTGFPAPASKAWPLAQCPPGSPGFLGGRHSSRC